MVDKTQGNNKQGEGEWKGHDIVVVENGRDWVLNSFVGRLKDLQKFDKLCNAYALIGSTMVKMKYIQENMVLITGLSEEKLVEMANQSQGKQGVLAFFHKFRSGTQISPLAIGFSG